MFLGRVWRKKRALLLPELRTPAKKPPLMSWSQPLHNVTTREGFFYAGCKQLHNCFCGCDDFINHLLRIQTQQDASALRPFTPPSTPRPVIRRALPAPAAPDAPAPWRGAGGGPAADADRGPGEDGGDYAPGDLDDLYAAVDAENAE